ncbi:MAG TPA: isopentenyl transferase family protein, partial [Longimicrobiales bacterium]|nr:isopentenyl transferase family protein [Longimicrobiales bacterium]
MADDTGIRQDAPDSKHEDPVAGNAASTRPEPEVGVGSRPAALVITGATATGKTNLAIHVAEAIGGEIISMDSRQVYRGMDIGTAKPTPEQRARVPHHGLDLVDPSERYSAGRFSADARRWIAEIRGRGHVPILVGGTGFFLRALTHPLFREPELPP